MNVPELRTQSQRGWFVMTVIVVACSVAAAVRGLIGVFITGEQSYWLLTGCGVFVIAILFVAAWVDRGDRS